MCPRDHGERMAVLINNPSPAPDVPTIGDERRAAWLLSDYGSTSWHVSDTHQKERVATIDFDYPLANGRSLLESERLLATVKEYAWWIRDPRFSAIDDAETHKVLVRNLMHLTHRLSLENIQSFSQLVPYDIERLVELCRFGLDSVLDASARIGRHLAALVEGPGLPVRTREGRSTRLVAAEQIIQGADLPTSCSRLPRVSWRIASCAQAHGLHVRPVAEEEPLLVNQTVQALQRWLDPIEQLYAMRRHAKAETLTFKPFPQGAAKVAGVKGVVAERTLTPPPRLVLHLLEGAARRLVEQPLQVPRTLASVRTMATACWIIIATFTARRLEEINELEDGCLHGDASNGRWLEIYIEKTLQRKEMIPVPLIVEKAVRVLETISADARRNTGDKLLFQWLDNDGRARFIDVARHLDAFAEAVGVPLHNEKGRASEAWHWHPHQFRRFFAILYFYRFDGSSIEALSHHLRHFNLEMTKRYITRDKEVAALWTDVEWGYMGHVARAIVAGERSVSGSAGGRLSKAASRLKDKYQSLLRVALPDAAGTALKLVMMRNGMVLTPKPWVTCSCPRTTDAAAKAACRTGQPASVGPDFAKAGPTVCSGCPHAIIEANRERVILDEARHLAAACKVGSRADTLFGEMERARLVDVTLAREAGYNAMIQAEDKREGRS